MAVWYCYILIIRNGSGVYQTFYAVLLPSHLVFTYLIPIVAGPQNSDPQATTMSSRRWMDLVPYKERSICLTPVHCGIHKHWGIPVVTLVTPRRDIPDPAWPLPWREPRHLSLLRFAGEIGPDPLMSRYKHAPPISSIQKCAFNYSSSFSPSPFTAHKETNVSKSVCLVALFCVYFACCGQQHSLLHAKRNR